MRENQENGRPFVNKVDGLTCNTSATVRFWSSRLYLGDHAVQKLLFASIFHFSFYRQISQVEILVSAGGHGFLPRRANPSQIGFNMH